MRMVSNTNPPASRAQEVRKRRAQRTQQRINTVTNRATHPVKTRPVTVRGNAFGTPIRQKASRPARRTLYLTVDSAAGAELRLPTLPMVNPGWRLLSGLLVILLRVAIYSLLNSPPFRVDHIGVIGLQRISADELTRELALQNLSIIEVNPAEIQAKLSQSFPELMEVEVGVELPNFVTVTAVERQPAMAWQKGEQVLWIDPEGVIFPARGDAQGLLTIHSSSDIPMVSQQPDTTEAKGKEAAADDKAGGSTNRPVFLQKADPALLSAAQTLREKLSPEVSLIYDPHNGLGWNDPMGWQVYVGNELSDFEAKLNMYQYVSGYLLDQGLQPALVSVAQLNAPFYRLEH